MFVNFSKTESVSRAPFWPKVFSSDTKTYFYWIYLMYILRKVNYIYYYYTTVTNTITGLSITITINTTSGF